MNIKEIKSYIEDNIEEYEETYHDLLEKVPLCVMKKRQELFERVHDYYLIIGVYKEILEKIEGEDK